ncbi:glycosyltransferase [Nocardioides sp.]|uniref:glycosyltransferase n=1 Tax=Nocardioides sp. TaxID=35761 RepID=UPI0030155406
MHPVQIGPIPLERLAGVLAPDRAERMWTYAQLARDGLAGRTVWNLSATATGGGVAEMLQALLGYTLGAGVDTRWLVLDGSPEFFRLTKRVHNLLHGFAGDGGPLGEAERATYEAVLDAQLDRLRGHVRPGDIVLLHDPQTAGLIPTVRELGARAIWRCHVGRDETNDLTDRVWGFLRPYLELADATVFSRAAYAPDWVDTDRLRIIAPSLDPFSPKNTELAPDVVAATLARSGLVALPDCGEPVDFRRRDGATGVVRRHEGIVVAGAPVPAEARLVLQVSRWDHLKDMPGVARGFVEGLDTLPADAHLMLAGPEAAGVSDDPEGAEVLAECIEFWRSLPAAGQARVSLCCLPMDDVDENAHLVNALQRHASVVVQKSLVEGFGLTVTEPMWKARPVVASRVGGIADQIVHGESGLLLDDPTDLGVFAGAVGSLLADPVAAQRLGHAARERVRDISQGDRHLIQYVELFDQLER